MTEPKPAWWTEHDFQITFEDRTNFFTCRHCHRILSFPRLSGAHSIEAALQAHLRSMHTPLEPVTTREEGDPR